MHEILYEAYAVLFSFWLSGWYSTGIMPIEYAMAALAKMMPTQD